MTIQAICNIPSLYVPLSWFSGNVLLQMKPPSETNHGKNHPLPDRELEGNAL
jgi:hypothetical protein